MPGSEMVPHEGCQSGMWGGHRPPSSPGNLSGQRASGGSHGAHSCTQEAGRLSPLEKGALLPCPSGRRESRRALGILTAQPPNKTQSPHHPLPPARAPGKGTPRSQEAAMEPPGPLPRWDQIGPCVCVPHHDLPRALSQKGSGKAKVQGFEHGERSVGALFEPLPFLRVSDLIPSSNLLESPTQRCSPVAPPLAGPTLCPLPAPT